jgi:hypothetical protein
METAMGMFDFLKPKKTAEPKEEKPKTHKIKTKTPKEKATEAGEPYVNVVQVELDPDDVGNGAFELDWNDIFVARLIKAGFKGKDDAQIVDQWFQSICRNILNENFEQWEANQPVDTRPRRVDRNDIGNGRTEVS